MTNDPTSAAYEAQLKINRELQLLKGEDDQYVLSTLASMYALPKLVEYIQQAIVEAEKRGRIAELEALRTQTREVTHPAAFISDESVAQSIRVHTNSLIEYRLAALQANADGANGRDGEDTNNEL